MFCALVQRPALIRVDDAALNAINITPSMHISTDDNRLNARDLDQWMIGIAAMATMVSGAPGWSCTALGRQPTCCLPRRLGAPLAEVSSETLRLPIRFTDGPEIDAFISAVLGTDSSRVLGPSPALEFPPDRCDVHVVVPAGGWLTLQPARIPRLCGSVESGRSQPGISVIAESDSLCNRVLGR